MKLPSFLLALCALSLMVATSAPAQLFETQAVREYEHCLVLTEVAPSKPAETQVLACGDFTSAHQPIISIFRDHDGKLALAVGFGSGLVDSSGALKPVTIRVDEGPLIERAAPWDQSLNSATIEDPDLARTLLPALARGHRVAISIGSKRGLIPLKGSARAVLDFRHRANLEIPAQNHP